MLSLIGPDSSIIVGDVRVQALSPTLVRVEPKGPLGFEDRPTFSVVGRDFFKGIPIWKGNDAVILHTDYWSLEFGPARTLPTCTEPASSVDVVSPIRAANFPDGAHVDDQGVCCALCDSDPSCSAFVFAPAGRGVPGANSRDVPGANCWPLASFESTTASPGRLLGCPTGRACALSGTPAFTLRGLDGALLFNSTAEVGHSSNLLHLPAPLEQSTYALVDFPRFYAPPWGATPIPDAAAVDPALISTNGYDFRTNVNGDTYVLLGLDTLDGYNAARAELSTLIGSCPLLPDFAFGTWFTWWHSYTEAEAKDDVAQWERLELPIDVWALDMNWRNTSDSQNEYYDHPASQLFSNFTEWFAFLRAKKLRTYFNDHPYPVASRGAGGLQTSAEEVAFRWAGLSSWMAKGLTFW